MDYINQEQSEINALPHLILKYLDKYWLSSYSRWILKKQIPSRSRICYLFTKGKLVITVETRRKMDRYTTVRVIKVVWACAFEPANIFLILDKWPMNVDILCIFCHTLVLWLVFSLKRWIFVIHILCLRNKHWRARVSRECRRRCPRHSESA